MKTSNNDTHSSLSLAKGILILRAFVEENSVWGVRAIAKHLSMSPSIVHRLLTTFVEFDYLIKDPISKKYSLGPGLLRLVSTYNLHNPLYMISNQVFNHHANEWPYLGLIGFLSGFSVIHNSVFYGSSPIRMLETTDKTYLHNSAVGKALLACQSDQFINDYINQRGLTRFTENTITDPNFFWDQIREIRKSGIAWNFGEHFNSICAVGAPVFDVHHEVCASVALVYPRLETQIENIKPEEMSKLILKIAAEISRRYAGFIK